ncbi:FtsX-like permease family protein [Aeromicrobium sp. YIM 150415]|uniref:Cell division protein FtsX n=1 Tax=Aeromicrobium piscarium TaxID=2590901 RepID=A0A554RVS8_9ACTN|nr:MULTISPECIES: permease-like cell division protein FtsX [Aeromicrobium]MBM9463148.1 FtsX-like permease family protein [Aeromicrobium sp. YIM 150415]TSD58216.1 FtsX-like permease family protein [Aeromicrobium piscarium]
MRAILSELRASLTRNASMTISLIVTMSVSLLLASLGLLIQAQADRTEQYFGDRLQLQVNLCTQNSPAATCVNGVATEEQQQAVQDALDSNPEVRSFEVRSPEQNYEQARELLGQTETGQRQLETLGPDSFPESYYVTLTDPQDFDGVVSQVSGMDGVGNVNSLRELLGPLFEMLDKLQWASLGTALLLIIAAILQVSNTIRMTAFARRREIGIMRLVGASSWHIQLPFVLESLVAALVSAALAASGMAAFMYFVVYGYLRDTLGTITTWVRWQDAFVVMGWTTALSILLALIPTLVMTRKYLNV